MGTCRVTIIIIIPISESDPLEGQIDFNLRTTQGPASSKSPIRKGNKRKSTEKCYESRKDKRKSKERTVWREC